MERPTRKFRSRIYVEVPVKEVQPGDIISYVTARGQYTRVVDAVTNINVTVVMPKGFSPKTKRIPRQNVKECWRWRSNVEDAE